MSVSFTISIEGLDGIDRDWTEARRILSAGIYAAVEKATEAGAAEARRTHRFTNRTGETERKTTGEVTRADDGSAEGEIICDVDHAHFLTGGTKPHEIRPKKARVLAWEGSDGEQHFAAVVHHPGTKPDPFMVNAERKARTVLEKELEKAVARAEAAVNK